MSIRLTVSHRAVRAGLATGLLAAALSGPGIALASPHSAPATRNLAPIEGCLDWTGTVTTFPALTSKPHAVTAVLQATLSNCEFYSTPQSGTGTAFGVLTGTATRGKATLSGNLAIDWPQSPGLSLPPTIAGVSLATFSHTCMFHGAVTAGLSLGDYVSGAYQVTSSAKIRGGTAQSIAGTSPPIGVYQTLP